ncbi:MAG: radical SAM protein [Nitrospirota bacterium]
MNVLIVNTNRHTMPVPVMPVGACMVADAAARAGHEVRFLDCAFEKDPLRALARELGKSVPDVVGLSIRNIDNNDVHNPTCFIKGLRSLIVAIRNATGAAIVLGGAAVAVMPEEIMRYTGVHCAVLGDGEVVFPRVLAALESGASLQHIPGIAWIERGRFRKNPCLASLQSESCAAPDFPRWIAIKTYTSRLATVPLQTKLGCQFKCIYCTYNKIEGSTYRLFSPGSVAAAVGKFASLGFHDIEFVDNVFNAPYEHALAVCDALARSRPRVRLQSLELNPLFLDDALITGMERAGFTAAGITVESASDAVLAGLGKNFSARHVYNVAEVMRRHRLPCLWIFLLGGPGETQETVKETLRFATTAVRSDDAVFFNIGIRIYPGTPLEAIARKQGLLSLSPQEMLESVFYISPEVSYNWIAREIQEAMNTHMNFICSDSIGLPFLPSLHRMGYRLGIRPPLWRYTRFIRRGLRLAGMRV